MTAGEQGFLLLTCRLGDPERKPLTVAQFRDLTRRARAMKKPVDDREMTARDLMRIGCSEEAANRILQLLSQTEQLEWYLGKARKNGCFPITRLDERYPPAVHRCLGFDAPGVLWAKGDASLLDTPKIALVGSRKLREENLDFARELGRQAALQGYTLVSGGANGADRTAQESCLEQGGSVVCVVADRLEKHREKARVLYLSEEGFDLGFSAQRALSRNRIIHTLGVRTFVAQCTLEKGGTWDGTCRNLKGSWTPVFCFRDGSDASSELESRGAKLVDTYDLADISKLQPDMVSFL